MIHSFHQAIDCIPLPEKFTFPFHYTPHPLCVIAAEEVKTYIQSRTDWQEELSQGKMFGVLVVKDSKGTVCYLAAFSGNLAGNNQHSFFVPPVYDLLQPNGFFKKEEKNISDINQQIQKLTTEDALIQLQQQWQETKKEATIELTQAKAALKAAKAQRDQQRKDNPFLSEEELAALIQESQFQKASLKRLEQKWKTIITELETILQEKKEVIERLKEKRKRRSAALQEKLFKQFQLLNALGETKDLCDIFKETTQKFPPAGSGECALPKMLQYAYLHHLQPLAMAEFWWGASPKNEIRTHGYYYPSCKGKCEPILKHMLQGLVVDENPFTQSTSSKDLQLETVYEDEWLVVINKPAGLLSVPGKDIHTPSVYQYMRNRYPQATGPLIVHRLDMATSGLLVITKDKDTHELLQQQFAERSVKKRYIALLDNSRLTAPLPNKGRIELPLCLNPMDRPRQMVSYIHGKTAITLYHIIQQESNSIRILFYPITGRTHQLRVHAAHVEGLNCPIIGDELYGQKDKRLYLHAEYLEFKHPITQQQLKLHRKADF